MLDKSQVVGLSKKFFHVVLYVRKIVLGKLPKDRESLILRFRNVS